MIEKVVSEKCQVFTPKTVVFELLNAIDYRANLYGKKVIENACGDGNILVEIVRRYIQSAIDEKKSSNEIKKGLEQDVYGAEIDIIHYQNCIKNLDQVSNSFGIEKVQWNILNGDFLDKEHNAIFDYVIGNPPYINYRELSVNLRSVLKERFSSCGSGKFDYCYAFIEASINSLKTTGKLAYLIPNSIFKNVFAEKLREIVLPSLTKVIDYKSKKIFEKALTSSSIIVCDNSVNKEWIEYKDKVSGEKVQVNKLELKKTEKWIFSGIDPNKGNSRFGDKFIARIGVATLLNEAFIIKKWDVYKNKILVEGFEIEKKIIRVAVSPRSMNFNKREYIIFPYKYNEGELNRYSEQEFEGLFPGTSKYLEKFKDSLRKRKADKSVKWFEYGRTQALAHLNQPKLLLSTVVTKEVKVYELDREFIPYSGIYITAREGGSLLEAKRILESDEFLKYVKLIGTNANGSSLRITSKDINNFVY